MEKSSTGEKTYITHSNRREYKMSDGIIRKISRVIFWRYRRGGWQYDILCIIILLFIFLVPRSVLDGSYFDGEDASVSEAREETTQSTGQPDRENDTPEEEQVPESN